MKKTNYIRNHYSYLIIIIFGLLYLSFLSNNPSGDSFANTYLSQTTPSYFSAHHLLYSFFGYIVLSVFPSTWSSLAILQVVNAMFSVFTLLLIRRIVKRQNPNEKYIAYSIVFCASTFSFLRFATDNECYIIPLFFTMLGIYYLQSFLRENNMQRLVKMALALVVGTLFHQIVVITMLSIFVFLCFNKNKKYVITYTLLSLIVPLTYWIISITQNHTFSLIALFHFITHDYYYGYAESPIIKQVVILGFVSFVRTFIQVHGYMFNIIKQMPILSISIIVICLFFFIMGIRHLLISKKQELTLFHQRRFIRIIWVTFIANLCFALLSNGNSEFMVLLPFLLTIIGVYYYKDNSFMAYLGYGFLLWNITFALIPYNQKNLNTNTSLVTYIHNNPNNIYLLKDLPPIENEYIYRYHQPLPQSIYIIRIKQNDIDMLLKTKKTIITDAYQPKDSKTISRSSIVAKEQIKILMKYSTEKNPYKIYKTDPPLTTIYSKTDNINLNKIIIK